MLKKYWEIIAASAAIIMISYLISTYYYQLMIVHGDSMYPALKNMHLALIDKRAEDLRAGDVVVFRCRGLKSMLVKRVAGCPGDTVKIEDGRLYVNGDESPLYRDNKIDYSGLLSDETVLGDNEYIVLGDNLEHSKDSRYEEVGIVDKKDITGRVIV